MRTLRRAGLIAFLVAASVAGCGTILGVSDPDIVPFPDAATTEASVTDGAGAETGALADAPNGGTCMIGGVTYTDGTADGDAPCQACRPALSTTTWSPVANGTPCANNTMTCTAGQCAPSLCSIGNQTYEPGDHPSGNFCETCQPNISSTAFTPVDCGGDRCVSTIGCTSPDGGAVCTPTTCSLGCCANGNCKAFQDQSTSQCGTAGNSCSGCPGQSAVCSQGGCTTVPSPSCATGETRCDGAGYDMCGEGMWSPTLTCPSGPCLNNACPPPATQCTHVYTTTILDVIPLYDGLLSVIIVGGGGGRNTGPAGGGGGGSSAVIYPEGGTVVAMGNGGSGGMSAAIVPTSFSVSGNVGMDIYVGGGGGVGTNAGGGGGAGFTGGAGGCLGGSAGGGSKTGGANPSCTSANSTNQNGGLGGTGDLGEGGGSGGNAFSGGQPGTGNGGGGGGGFGGGGGGSTGTGAGGTGGSTGANGGASGNSIGGLGGTTNGWTNATTGAGQAGAEGIGHEGGNGGIVILYYTNPDPTNPCPW